MMSRIPSCWIVFSVVVLNILAGTALLDAAGPTDLMPPRYRLQVGQELVFRGRSEFQYKGGQFLQREAWNCWVVRENPDHTWRIILKRASTFTQLSETAGDDERKAALQKHAENLNDTDAVDEVEFVGFDFAPDGRCLENTSFGFRTRPYKVLPSLPQTLAEGQKGWKTQSDKLNETIAYRLLPESAANECLIETLDESPFNAIYGMVQQTRVTFDLQRGLPRKFVTETRQTFGFDGKGTGTIELVELKTHSAEWCQQFSAESEQCLSQLDGYEQATLRQDLLCKELQNALLQREAEFHQLEQKLQSPELKALMMQRAKARESVLKYVIEAAKEREALLGTASETWKTTDLAGTEYSLKDYRGKVVVLDFWYRGCGWCIRAMPQIKEVAAHFKDQPVVVFGMNTDSKEDDAKFVVEKMGLNYVNLKAAELTAGYKVSGFPTLLILDQQGIIRDVHVGCSLTLKDEVIRSVEKLLATPP
jgi:thiol-disulfide isomerase/thioredoxin